MNKIGSTEKELTGYPSIDRPWLKYYSEEALNAKVPQCTIYEYLWENNKACLNSTAINYYGHKISYHTMFEEIDRVAHAFMNLGVKTNDVVVIVAVTIPEIVYSIYALNRLGAISNVVDPRTSASGIRKYISEAHAKYVLSLDVLSEKMKEAIAGTNVEKFITVLPLNSFAGIKGKILRVILRADKAGKDVYPWRMFMSRQEGDLPSVPYKENACCVIVHTGGTTGFPKGVMLSNENLNAMVINARASEGSYEAGNVFLNIMPPFIAYGLVNGIHMILSCGMENVLIPQFNPAVFDKLILKYRPTHILGVPTHYARLFESKKLEGVKLSFLKIVGVGGDSLSAEMERHIADFLHMHGADIPIATGYGMTEVSAAACGFHKRANRVGSVGIPFVNTVIRIVDSETGREQKYGEQGEILISSPALMLGYDNNQEETKQVIFVDDNGQKWIHSGDIGHMDQDGFLYIDGRIKRMIIRHDGFKVFPSQIENVIATDTDVCECCAVGRSDKAYSQGKLPVVYVVLKQTADKEKVKSDLLRLCADNLPEYAQPIDIICIEKMPLTDNGKIDFRVLEEREENR